MSTQAKMKIEESFVYVSLDAWRGIACLMVVLCHTYGALETKINIPTFDIFRTVTEWGRLGVQIFFVISGYCIINACTSVIRKGKTVSDFAFARFRRIFLPYWMVIPAYVFVNEVGYLLISHHLVHSGKNEYFQPFDQSLMFYITNLSLTQTFFHQKFLNGVAWTLNYEISFYFICGVTLVITKLYCQGEKERFNLVYSHFLTALILLLTLCGCRWVCFPFDLWPQFGIGIVVYDLLQMHPYRFQKALCLLVLSLTLGVCLRHLLDCHVIGLNNSASAWFVFLVFSIVLIKAYSFDEAMQKSLLWRWISKIGTRSYTIYLLHTVVIVFATQAVAMLHIPGVFSMLISLSVVTIAITVASCCYNLIERPFLKKIAPA